jgi:hypothetical protein
MADQPPQKMKGILAFLKPLSVEQFEEQKRRDVETARKQAEEAAAAGEQQAAAAKAAKRPVGRPRKTVVINLINDTPVSKRKVYP